MIRGVTLDDAWPPLRRWRTWTASEPILSGLSSERLRIELAHSDPGRRDELLGALVRIARRDSDAVAVVAAALAPGVRARTARYAPGLAREDAWSIAIEGLCRAITLGPPPEQFVASRLLDAAKRHLQRAVADEIAWRDHDHHVPDRPAADRTDEPSAELILTIAATADVLSCSDAWLLHSTAVAGHSLGWAAGRIGIGYEAAKKRRQRAGVRWRAWWDPPDQPANRTGPRLGAEEQRPVPGGDQEPAA